MSDVQNIKQLQFAEYNPRQINEDDFKALQSSMTKFGDISCVVRNVHTGNLVCGHQRVRALLHGVGGDSIIEYTDRFAEPDKYGTVAVGYIKVPNTDLRFAYREVTWTVGTEQAANIAANRIQGAWDLEKLAEVNYQLTQLPDGEDLLRLTGQHENEIKKLLASIGVGEPEQPKGNLNDAFVVPPFSILDTKQGYWQARKQAWNDRIGDLGESRKKALSGEGMMKDINNGVSILDAVLAELTVRWFGYPGGKAYDPFAGDTVFGYVAAATGMIFTGIELRQEQVDLNQARVNQDSLEANYICDDALNQDKHIEDGSQDLIFSCPPYADLEVYSELPNDLSTMSHEDFYKVYTQVLQGTYKKLKDNRFAVVVTSEVRNKAGAYISLVPKTIELMQAAGYTYYNELILVNSVGTLPQRVARSMRNRKVGRQHQNVLVFYKGDLKQIKDTYPELKAGTDFEEQTTDENPDV